MKKSKIISLIALALIVLSISSCSKEHDGRWIEGQLIIMGSNEPLRNYTIAFDVQDDSKCVFMCGGGILGSGGPTFQYFKYRAISDENGYYSFQINADDEHRYLYPHSIYLPCDTTQWNYELADYSSISKNINTTIHFSPRGHLDFYTPDSAFLPFGADMILVKSKYATDTLSKPGWRNKLLYVEPSQIHTFTYIAIKNNQVIKQISKDIYIQDPCTPKFFEYYEVNF